MTNIIIPSVNNILITSPLTNNKDVSLIYSINSNKLINDWITSFSIDISDELTGCNTIDLYKCNETGLRFFAPPSVAGSEQLYSDLQKFDWFYMPWKWEHEILFTRLQKSERILEVGCATGAFVEKLYLEGYKIEGIEFNSLAVEKAQAKGLPVSQKNLCSLANNDTEIFDVVCSFQVLEHIPNPSVYIDNCISILKRSGRFILCVPNNDSFLKYQYNLLDMPPHHMTQWDIGVFHALENLYPIKLSHVRYEPLAAYHVNGYLQAHQKRLVEKCTYYRLIMNKFTIPILKIALKSRLNRFCRGQSIYVEFIKL